MTRTPCALSAAEVKWCNHFRTMQSSVRRPFDVYFDTGTRKLYSRQVNEEREPKALPEAVLLVGRYKRPFPADIFIVDLRLLLAGLEG